MCGFRGWVGRPAQRGEGKGGGKEVRLAGCGQGRGGAGGCFCAGPGAKRSRLRALLAHLRLEDLDELQLATPLHLEALELGQFPVELKHGVAARGRGVEGGGR